MKGDTCAFCGKPAYGPFVCVVCYGNGYHAHYQKLARALLRRINRMAEKDMMNGGSVLNAHQRAGRKLLAEL